MAASNEAMDQMTLVHIEIQGFVVWHPAQFM
jgi:hypothetical protein